MPTLDPQALDLLRAQSGLSIDAEGRLCHRGEPITHARTLEVLWRSLDREPDGRYSVRVGREMGYVEVADVPYVVQGVSVEEGWPLLHLGDGRIERLDPATLSIGPDGVLRCLVREGQHGARFGRGAQVTLGLMLEQDAAAPERLLLRLGDRTFTLPQAQQ